MRQFENLKMRKHLIFGILLTASCLLLIASCGVKRSASYEPIVIENEKVITKERIVRDTIVKTKVEQVRTEVQVDCDEQGKVRLRDDGNVRQSETERSRSLKQTVTIQDNVLTVDCRKEAEEIALQLYDNYVKEQEKTTKPIYIEKPLKRYQEVLMYAGVAFWVLVVTFIIGGIINLSRRR